MNHTKVIGPIQISTPDGNDKQFPLSIFPGGKNAKRIQWMIVVDTVSDATNGALGLILDHGPDGRIFKNHSTVITSAAVGTPPIVLEGTALDTTNMIGEYRRPILVIGDIRAPGSKTAQHMTVTVYETAKPF